jgi:hypothetical protein
MDYSKLPTPPTCVADFCLIPVCHPVPPGERAEGREDRLGFHMAVAVV